MEPSKLFMVELPFTVKTYDVDFAGIVHNLVYLRWLEDLRLQILADYYPVTEMLADDIAPILVKTVIEYKWPLRLGDPAIRGRLWLSDLGRARWTVQGEICLGEKVAAAATQQGYFASMETMRPVPMPGRLRVLWETNT